MTNEPINKGTQEEPPTGSGRKINVMGALRRQWIKGLIAFCVVVLLGSPFAWKKGKAHYRAEGAIYISPHNIRNLDADEEQEIQSNTQFREFMEQQAHTINRYDIILPIVTDGAPGAHFFRYKNEDDRRATDRLRGALQIAAVPDTYQMTVALEGDTPRGLAEVVNAVMENYVQVARKEMYYDSDTRLSNLDEEKNRIKDEIAKAIEQRDQVAAKLGTTLFNAGVINNYEKIAGDNMSALLDARRQRLTAEAALGAKGSTSEIEEGIQAVAAQQANSDPALTSYRSALIARRAELVLKIQGLAPKHPGRIEAEKDIAGIDDELKRAATEARKLAAANLHDVERGKVAQSAALENSLSREADDIQARANNYMRNYQLAINIGDELERLNKRLNATEERISTLQLEVKSPGSVRIFSPAMTPQFPVTGGRKKLLAIVLLVALVLSVALPVAFDFLDPAVRSAGELEAVLGLPVTGWLPCFRRSEPVADEVLRLAVTLRRHIKDLSSGALVISALRHGSGSSTIALLVGKSLDLLGVRTLVIEINPQTPDVRYIEGGNRPGYAQWIGSQANLQDCVNPATTLLPARISTGSAAQELALMSGNAIRILIDEARKDFDLVLIDAAPIGLSLLTEELVRDLDSILLVSQAHVDNRKEIKATMKVIERLRPRTFGSIINKVPAGSGKAPNDTPDLLSAQC